MFSSTVEDISNDSDIDVEIGAIDLLCDDIQIRSSLCLLFVLFLFCGTNILIFNLFSCGPC